MNSAGNPKNLNKKYCFFLCGKMCFIEVSEGNTNSAGNPNSLSKIQCVVEKCTLSK